MDDTLSKALDALHELPDEIGDAVEVNVHRALAWCGQEASHQWLSKRRIVLDPDTPARPVVSGEPGKWFAHDNQCGFETFDSEAGAMGAAEEMLNAYREIAPDGWDDDVESVCWGRIHGSARQTNRRDTPEGQHDYICDYELTPANGGATAPEEECENAESGGDLCELSKGHAGPCESHGFVWAAPEEEG